MFRLAARLCRHTGRLRKGWNYPRNPVREKGAAKGILSVCVFRVPFCMFFAPLFVPSGKKSPFGHAEPIFLPAVWTRHLQARGGGAAIARDPLYAIAVVVKRAHDRQGFVAVVS